MRISDGSSDVCSSDLAVGEQRAERHHELHTELLGDADDLLAEAAPAHVGLDTAEQHLVAIAVGGVEPADGDLRRGPGRRQGVVWGKSVSGRVGLGGRRIIKKKKKKRKKER